MSLPRLPSNRGRALRRNIALPLVATCALAAASDALGAPAAGPVRSAGEQTALEQWQSVANGLRLPLVAPLDPPGFSLTGLSARRETCGRGGPNLAEVTAGYRRSDGARIELRQGYPVICANIGTPEIAGGTLVRGTPARYLWAGGGGECFVGEDAAPCLPDGTVAYADSLALAWQEGGPRPGQLFMSSNLVRSRPLAEFAASLTDVRPVPARRPLWTRAVARATRVVSTTRVGVSIGGRRRTVRLPCARGQALATLRRALPRGRAIVLETDPVQGGRFGISWVYRSRSAVSGLATLNARLVSSGLLRVQGASRFRRPLRHARADARGAKRGMFGPLCHR
jgi:hypothetical protein